MTLSLPTWLSRPFAFLGGPGPLFDKELRVASRRRRGYGLRCVYVLVLTAFIAIIWIPAVELQGGGAMSRAQMETAAKTITISIVWFQFLAAQLVAVALLSTAISDEVYGRTLCALLTTPLSNRQVVLNKLWGRLFQILLLVATSLPLLAIVRVLGGIPWVYLIVSLCLTASTVVLAGSVSLLFSVLCRRSYVVMIVSILSIASLFLLAPFLCLGPFRNALPQKAVFTSYLYWNPYFLLFRYTDYTMAPRVHLVSAWQVVCCCASLLAMAAVVLAWAVGLVRSVALHRALGERGLLERLRRGRIEDTPAKAPLRSQRHDIRRVVGPPMIWKELTCTLSRRQRLVTNTVIGIEVLLILIAYLFPSVVSIMPYEMVHLMCLWTLLAMALLFTITSSATVMGTERESGAWPMLLMTPLTDREILVGKFVGVLRRCGAVWLSLLAYVAAFAWAKCFHPLAIVHVTAITVSFLLFLSATGFYFGSRFRRSSEAVTANLVLAGVLWCVPPIVGTLVDAFVRSDWNGGSSVACMLVPFGEISAMALTTMEGGITRVPWFGHRLDAWGIMMLMFVSMAGYSLASLAFTWRAVRGFRRGVFLT